MTTVETDESFGGVTPDAARRLLLGAVQAFAERGFHATTTRDIAGRAGMSPAALYIHYKTKEELLFHISRVGHERSVAVLTEAAQGTATTGAAEGAGGAARGTAREGGAGGSAPRLARAVRAFVRWHAEHHTTARVVQYELAALDAEHYEYIVALRRRSEEILRGVLEDGVATGEFDIADIRGTALAVMSLCIDVARWFSPEGRRTPDEIGALYADLALRMAGHTA
ncbi:TetR/AcrR family transcriptional regulator [Streptomyces tubbatahanensis]|uniref:TetR/AcrR family transcriptional regulator n=1 Tax=Streptomyces tubbatahanensis TaxID=2923272 RepID=A0ABY3XP67_9ACTN|nr:TetR/AcrR family transcriptional regulator [Streptomyces tubbatahanensis]UNS96210.1 TetR/AcrR family transcriptional regulator [Streptomyces tubbatahanensis]